MSEISINPVALHIVGNVYSNSDVKEPIKEVPQKKEGAAVVANVRGQGQSTNEIITSSVAAKAATAATSELIKSDTAAAMRAQADYLPSEVLELLED